MDADDRNRFLDELLDHALEQFGHAEPRLGLENRMLANLRAESKRMARTCRWVLVLGTAMVATFAIIAIWIATSRPEPANLTITRRQVSGQPSVTSRQDQPREIPLRTREPQHVNHASLRSSRGKAVLPRLRQFPSPRPLSNQEELFLAYVKAAPNSEVIAAIKRANDTSDLRIKDLEIPPLNSE
jgi:hypothetical protein